MFAKQALSIGINAYVPSYLTLRPCINDANDLSNSLRSIGFQSYCATDLDLNSMKSIIHQFINSIQSGAVVLFYFSGHGVQYNGNNYLVPKNAVGICADNIKSTAIDAQKLINSMYVKSPRLIICILDCCRTDPPTQPLVEAKVLQKPLSGTKAGLAPMQAPTSTIIVYACAADDTASARSINGRNSLYTYHLLRYIRIPNVDIETILKYVAVDVQRDSDNVQIPYRYSSCNEIICLASNQRNNASMLRQCIKAIPITQPSTRQSKKVSAIQRSSSQHNNFGHQFNGQLALPRNHQIITRTSVTHRKRILPRSSSPLPKDSRHHAR